MPPWLGGTKGYASPEQRAVMAAVYEGRAVGDAVDGRSDLYSLGVLLYEALGGDGPEPGGAARPPLHRLNPHVSVGLSDLIHKCLRADPRERYPDAAALATDLRRHLNHLPLLGVPNRSPVERWRKWRRRRPSALTRQVILLSVWPRFPYNSGMIRIHLDDATRDELQTLRRADLPPRARDRLEMVCLADAGWAAPRIADHLGYCGHTVRAVLKDFLGRGIAALFPRRTGPPLDDARRREVTGALRALLGDDRTWTSRQLSQALVPRGIALARAKSAATSGCSGRAGAGPPAGCGTSRTRPGSRGPSGCCST